VIPAHLLDGLLAVVVGLWAALSVTIVLDRFRYDRRTRRLQRSVSSQPSAAESRDAGRITAADFQQLTAAGMPAHVEVALAEGLRARLGERQLRAVAEGVVPADLQTRSAALQILASAREPEVHDLLDRCLRSDERELAAAAVRMLIRLDSRDAAQVLIAALRDGVHSPSRLAAAIDRMSVPRDDLLAPLIADADSVARYWGVRLAGRLGAVAWAPTVRTLTADADALVRRAAVEALGAIGEPKDRVLLLIRFLDPAAAVRVHAARASAAFPDAAVADALTELLRDREWIVRAAARNALQRLGAVATTAVVRTLWDEDGFAANSAAEVLFASGAALGIARDLLKQPDHADVLRTMSRFLAVAGPHLTRALLDHLTTAETNLLLSLVRDDLRVGGGRHP
jgi:HEAT repeat protein